MKYRVSYTVKKNDFPKMAHSLPRKVADIKGKTALELVRIADPNTPVLTGNMKNNKEINPGDIGVDAYVHWRAPYTGFVHNGTRYMPARPFIARAVEQVWPMFNNALQEVVQDGGL